MFEVNNSIIIVDDQQEHLNRLSNIFCQYGIACRTLLYGEMIEMKPLTGVKIAFFDVMLATSGDENAQMATLQNAMKTYISSENKAFVLVLWTSHPDYKDKFIEFVNRPGNSEGMPKPIEIEVIDKTEFIENEEQLQSRLETLMDDTIVRCLFSFNKELREASDKSLSEVLRLIPFPDPWGSSEEFMKNVQNVFAKIAVETFGKSRGMEYPDIAIKEVFGPLFLHHLCSNGSTVWQDFFAGKNISKVKEFPNPEIVAHLNTIFHLDYSLSDSEARGIVRLIDINNPDIVELFISMVKYEPNQWIREVLFNNCKHQGVIRALVAVEISAACDYSNGKKRTHQYLLGAILPNGMFEMLHDAKFSDAVFRIPFTFMFRDEMCNMLLHFNYLLTEEESTLFKLLGNPLFGLKNEVMNMIGDRHAHHISRIGITSFR